MATSIIKTDEIRRLNDQVLMSDGALTSNVVFPAGPSISGQVSGGHVLQVQQKIKTDTWSDSIGTGAESENVTGLNCSITPSSTSSKILVSVSVSTGSPDSQFAAIKLYCNNSQIGQGDVDNSATRVSASSLRDSQSQLTTTSFSFLHQPSSIAEQSYSIRIVHGSSSTQTIYVNREYFGGTSAVYVRGISTITAMEIQG